MILLQFGPLSRIASHMRSQLMFAASLTDGCTATSWSVRALSLIIISFLILFNKDWVPILESSTMHCCTISTLYTFCEARVWNVLEAMLSSSEDKRQNRNPSFRLRVLTSIED